MCRWRASVHHVRARTPRFVCGGDDYLFILFDGISQVRAIPPPALATAAATAAIAAPRSCCRHERAVLLTRALHPWASQGVDCCSLRLLAGGVACDKWHIQKWPFATASASVLLAP